MNKPEVFISDPRHRITPRTLVQELCVPILAHVLLEHPTQQRRDPSRHMNAVSYVRNRNVRHSFSRKQLLPQRARNFAVLAADSVRRPAHTNRKRRQSVSLHFVGGIDASQHERSEEHTSELQSRLHLVCRLLLEKKK